MVETWVLGEGGHLSCHSERWRGTGLGWPLGPGKWFLRGGAHRAAPLPELLLLSCTAYPRSQLRPGHGDAAGWRPRKPDRARTAHEAQVSWQPSPMLGEACPSHVEENAPHSRQSMGSPPWTWQVGSGRWNESREVRPTEGGLTRNGKFPCLSHKACGCFVPNHRKHERGPPAAWGFVPAAWTPAGMRRETPEQGRCWAPASSPQ